MQIEPLTKRQTYQILFPDPLILSQGTDNAQEILIPTLFGQDITVISPQDYLLRPSARDYSIVKQLVVEPIDADPMDIDGKTIYQGDSFWYGNPSRLYRNQRFAVLQTS